MAHFAKLDENNVVIDTTVVLNEDITVDGVEIEQLGIDLCARLTGHANWKQYSRNTFGNVHYGDDRRPDGKAAFRYNAAQIGGRYDPVRDAFIHTKPFESWVFNNLNCIWEPASRINEQGIKQVFDEISKSWINVPTLATLP
jgi:hypothetical protein